MFPVSMCRRFGALASVCIVMSAAGTSAARVADAASDRGPAAIKVVDDKALSLAMAVRSRALASSFDALETFAEQARSRNDAEGLSRLQHVVTVMIQQREYERAAAWNNQLEISAKRQRQAHYVEASKINALVIRNYAGKRVSDQEVRAVLQRQTHWLPRVMAKQALARVLVDQQRPAEAIAVLASAIPAIPEGKEQVAGIGGAIWDTVSLVHGAVDDVPGFIVAVEHAERYKSASTYPQPDFEAIYNMVQSLGFVGRYEEATGGVAIYRELADRAGTPMLQAMAASICGYASAVRDDWQGVLECYAPYGEDLRVPKPARAIMLARRATAYARTGQLANARRDLEEIRSQIAAGGIRRNQTFMRAEAEYQIAAGNYAQGIPLLRDYHITQLRRAAQSSAATMEQVLVNMDEKIHEAEERADLKTQTIYSQRWLMILGGVLGFVFGVMFFRQRGLSRQLAKINKRQREEQRRQNEFFANISHEIRTPLNGVVAMADAISNTSLTPEAAKMARIIATSSNSLERLLSDILDSAKIEAGQVDIEAVPMDLAQILSAIEALWTPRAAEKGLRIVTYLEGATSGWVMGDAVRLTQVLNNLVSNAIKFTDSGKIAISVVPQKDDRYVFAVTDSGVGFNNSIKAQLFKRFRQADSSITRRFGGSGLGLPISKQLVELMGGELDCDSAPGHGAQFWFEIHLPKAAQPEGTGQFTASSAAASRFLIVDDNATNRTILAMLLKDDTRQLHFAENGKEAVEIASRVAFDVILMDMQMPVMSGIDAIKAIRAHEAKTAARPSTIAILSANADSQHQREGAEAGADGHIAKPIVLERLLNGIEIASQKRALANAGFADTGLARARRG